MIPRRVLVVGGIAVVAGGAVYVCQPEDPPKAPAPSSEPDVRWLVEDATPGDAAGGGTLAIRDPLRTPSSFAASADFARPISAATPVDAIDAGGTVLRPSFIRDPELPARFAAPASASFAVGSQQGLFRTPVVPLDARDGERLAADALDAALPLQAASVAPAGAAANAVRPVAIGRHKIKDGETLEEIAAQNYGDPALAAFLFERNRRVLKFPDLLPVGREIVLYAPPAEGHDQELSAGAAPEKALASSPAPGVAAPKTVLPGVQTPILAPLE